MNDNARKWVEALRSGEFEQETGKLSNDDGTRHCCLGVACELYRREVGGSWAPSNLTGQKFTPLDGPGSSSVLPDPVRAWLGVTTLNGAINDSLGLSDLNDRGDSFEDIADVIESEPEGLFV